MRNEGQQEDREALKEKQIRLAEGPYSGKLKHGTANFSGGKDTECLACTFSCCLF
jgi:hypothetical protein